MTDHIWTIAELLDATYAMPTTPPVAPEPMDRGIRYGELGAPRRSSSG